MTLRLPHLLCVRAPYPYPPPHFTSVLHSTLSTRKYTTVIVLHLLRTYDGAVGIEETAQEANVRSVREDDDVPLELDIADLFEFLRVQLGPR